MLLVIPDYTLHALRATEAAARVGIARRLFDAELLGLKRPLGSPGWAGAR